MSHARTNRICCPSAMFVNARTEDSHARYQHASEQKVNEHMKCQQQAVPKAQRAVKLARALAEPQQEGTAGVSRAHSLPLPAIQRRPPHLPGQVHGHHGSGDHARCVAQSIPLHAGHARGGHRLPKQPHRPRRRWPDDDGIFLFLSG